MVRRCCCSIGCCSSSGASRRQRDSSDNDMFALEGINVFSELMICILDAFLCYFTFYIMFRFLIQVHTLRYIVVTRRWWDRMRVVTMWRRRGGVSCCWGKFLEEMCLFCFARFISTSSRTNFGFVLDGNRPTSKLGLKSQKPTHLLPLSKNLKVSFASILVP